MDRQVELVAVLRRAVLEAPGATDEVDRRAAFIGEDVPEPWRGYVAMVREASYRVSGAEVAGLLAAGHSEDAVFEMTLAAALGAANVRLDAGLRALRGAG